MTVQTLTDELLGEIELSEQCDCGLELDRADVAAIAGLIRTLRAENAELRKDAGRYRFYRLGMNDPDALDLRIDTAMEQAK